MTTFETECWPCSDGTCVLGHDYKCAHLPSAPARRTSPVEARQANLYLKIDECFDLVPTPAAAALALLVQRSSWTCFIF